MKCSLYFVALLAVILWFTISGNVAADDSEGASGEAGKDTGETAGAGQGLPTPGAGGIGDPAGFIGFTLEELLRQFGAPLSVYAVRGLEEWQDDVVFVYNEADFYVYKDRVWQLGLKSAYGIKTGDSRSSAMLAMQGPVEQSASSYVQCSLQNKPWNTKLRVNFDRAGLVSIIFVYRSDF
ncbi:MAG: hypothetical protein LBQ88_12320 [Treponema sp.]|jgi:hypothetical protein|nr:hypothetical protein [Treponema sp.]